MVSFSGSVFQASIQSRISLQSRHDWDGSPFSLLINSRSRGVIFRNWVELLTRSNLSRRVSVMDFASFLERFLISPREYTLFA